MLKDKKILLGISGSIAVYKVADWVRELRRAGADVKVIMTRDATRFVSPLTFAALSGNKVHEGMFDPDDAEKIPHINLAREADLLLIGPATAQTIARLAHGMADELLSAAVLAADSPILVCPAMNSRMFLHPATQANLHKLKEFGYTVIEPDCGNLACNEEGPGRLAEWPRVFDGVLSALSKQDLAGRKILISAGPTREPLDPVRYLGNRSSGKMGFALAAAARRRGAEVVLVSGPVSLADPAGVETIRVNTATEMADEIFNHATSSDVIIKAAAVSDFRPEKRCDLKMKKSGADLALPLAVNQDILLTLGKMKKEQKRFPLLVGFAAESHDLLEEGLRKLADKNLDLLAVNDITAEDAGFAVDTNRIMLLDRNGAAEKLPLMNKTEVADIILSRVARMLNA
ncbi:MAG: bifunctional phosphopantothenoylcysteine decarboxylase/phosphopantothenate--cysteine ligase CoaBC [Proteobacteria bacterium]|nr:bifunctional phosphopantothenoylcysteine decarboxylase/phosphopantothenate--cysteine ligase CoaBC [Pseudomonadota bacterium]MBU1739259.1 bifunctional phosphopantothenoylcysteine decarboxylase/phosphopantothenate--cysteine ligase CoaBC [Pseudomonadota bacterium]